MAGSSTEIIAQPRRSLPWLVALAVIATSPRARIALFAFLQRLLSSFRISLGRLVRPAVRKDFLGAAALPASGSRGSAVQVRRTPGWGTADGGGPSAQKAGNAEQGSFADFANILPAWLCEGLDNGGFHNLKPIQRKILPLALSGKDVCGVAPTGSGKTLAFLVPGLVHIAGQQQPTCPSDGPIMLVLAPTRELAVQIGRVAEGLMQPSSGAFSQEGSGWGRRGSGGFRHAVLYGGARRSDQLDTLRFQKATHLVVATPGRLLDFLEERAFTLQRVSFFVLDEGDRMLDFGFEPDVTAIARQIRKDRQMLFFSATWPSEVEEAAVRLCQRGQSFEKVSAKPDESVDDAGSGNDRNQLPGRPGIAVPPKEIRQIVEVIVGSSGGWDFREDAEKKVPLLLNYLEDALGGVGPEAQTPGKALIFVGTRVAAEELGQLVTRHFGLSRVGIMHGARKQEQREATLQAFRQGRIRALVATDVLGRGVDIPHVTHVVVYDFPGDIETYIHRVGRTGRNGEPGTAITFFEPRPWFPDLSKELVGVLRACDQPVPAELDREAGTTAMSHETWSSWEGGTWWNSQRPDDGHKGPEPMWIVEPAQAWRRPPPLESDSTGLATAEELGEWNCDGNRVWGYSANGGKTQHGLLELRSGGKLRTTWGWGEWALLPSAPHCPRPSRACPSAAAAGREPSPAPGTGEAGSAAAAESNVKQPAKPGVPHLSLTWSGCSDVVALDADGRGFKLITRGGKPADAYKSKTLGRALPDETM